MNVALIGFLALFCLQMSSPAQQPQRLPPTLLDPPPVEKVGPNLFRVGTIRVDTAKREIAISGRLNDATVLEFFANAKGGLKAYECALTLDTDPITFNVALVLIGLDRQNAKVSDQHFDRDPVSGDPVAITVEWTPQGSKKVESTHIERLLLDKDQAELPKSDWVYTGSMFYPDGRYGASVDGVLIGFAHTPTSIIESVKGIGLGRYGAITLNKKLGIDQVTPLTVRITALPRAEQSHKF